MKFRKKPVIIEAIQFVDNMKNLVDIHKFVGEDNSTVREDCLCR